MTEHDYVYEVVFVPLISAKHVTHTFSNLQDAQDDYDRRTELGDAEVTLYQREVGTDYRESLLGGSR